MIQYICKHCDNLKCETSVCPVCGNRTQIYDTAIYYCDECNVPVFNDVCDRCNKKTRKIGKELRPVFAQERLLIETLLGFPMQWAGKSVWSTKSNTYWVDGTKISISMTELRKKDPKLIRDEMSNYASENQEYVDSDCTNDNIKKFVECNKFRLNIITSESIAYIKSISKDFDESEMFVSFSGGKDSTVTSNLVMKALGTEKIMHIYGDTTLEYPESEKYLNIFRQLYPQTPVLIAKNRDQVFDDLCNVVGPPSRVMRWCCTVFKTGAITKKIEQIFGDKKRLLSFQGIRRAESASRSKYDRDSKDSKITKQQVASPIIDWLDFDVWLYILSNNLPFNNAYRQGFSRVGCWCCPNNSSWSEFLSSIYMPQEFAKWRGSLYDFAKKVGKDDWKTYIDEGNWKARQGGNGLEYSKKAVVTFTPCVLEADAYNFELSRPISEDLYTLFKPFGQLNFELGNKRLNEVYILGKRTGNPVLKLSGRIGSTTLRITVLDKKGTFKNAKVAEQLLNDQITKYQTCIGCAYCQSVCKFNALKVMNTEPGKVNNDTIRYTIDENMCVGCLECVKHFDGGCYMKKVLRVKKG